MKTKRRDAQPLRILDGKQLAQVVGGEIVPAANQTAVLNWNGGVGDSGGSSRS